MSAGLRNFEAGSGAKIAGIDLRAIDQIGIKRPLGDLEAARAELRRGGE